MESEEKTRQTKSRHTTREIYNASAIAAGAGCDLVRERERREAAALVEDYN